MRIEISGHPVESELAEQEELKLVPTVNVHSLSSFLVQSAISPRVFQCSERVDSNYYLE